MTGSEIARKIEHSLADAESLRRRALRMGFVATVLLWLGAGSLAAAAQARPDEAFAPAATSALSLPLGGGLAAWTVVVRNKLHAARGRIRSALSDFSGHALPDFSGESKESEESCRADPDRCRDALASAVTRFYAACSGSVFQRRWRDFAELFEPGAGFVSAGLGPQGADRERETSVSEFIARARTFGHWGRFVERRSIIHVAGALGLVLSEFECAAADGTKLARGVNCFEFGNRDCAWKIRRVICAAAAHVTSTTTEAS